MEYANESKARMLELAAKAEAALTQDAAGQIAVLNDMAREAF